MTSTTAAPALLTKSFTTTAGKTHIDLAFSTTMSKGGGSIFVTDGAVQTVINRSTGQPELRVVGATVTREIPVSQVSINGAHVEFDASGLAAGRAYNVFMGSGTLVGDGRAFAGISAPGQVVFTTPEAAPAPALGATIDIEDRTLRAGEDLTVTVTFSEAVTALNQDAVSAEHARIKGMSASADGLTWTITIGAADSIDSASNLLRLDMSQIASTGGLRGSGMLASRPYAVDTIVDAWLTPHISVSDTGPFDNDGITYDRTQTASGFLAGSLAADEHIELTINGRSVDPALVHLEVAGEGWSWTYDANDETGEPPVFGEGENTIVARIVNADGHGSAAVVQRITLDTIAPSIATSPHGATDLAVGADIVITFDEAVYWQDQEGDGDVLHLFGDNDTVIKVVLSAANFSEDGRTLTIKPADHKLQADTGYSLRLPENLLDLAGNPLQSYEMAFHTVGGPSAVRVFVDGDGSYRAGETLTFRIRFDEAVRTVGDAVPTLGLSNGAQAQFAAVNGTEMSFTYTVANGDDKAGLAISDTSGLAGKVQDIAGNLLAADHIVFSGIYDNLGHGIIGIDIDTAAAAPAAPLLANASNSGSLLDNITSDRTPTLAGSAEAHALVEIYKGATLLGSGYADAGGNWEATVALEHALADGLHELTVRQVDKAGNASSASGLIALTIDASAPAALAGVFLASDTGVSNSDRITRENYAVLSGTGAEANAVINIMNGAALAGVGTSDANGNWTASVDAPLQEGVHTVTVLQLDKAGNSSAASTPLSFTIDRTAPETAPPAPVLAAVSDTGILDNDGITSDTTPTFTGTGAMANTIVGLYLNDRAAGTAMTNALGNWTITALGDGEGGLVDGNYSVGLKQFDVAGNASDYSALFNLVVDISAPVTALTLDLAAASDSGASAIDNLTKVTTPTFSGSGAAANGQVALLVGATEIGCATADALGNWSFTIEAGKALADGVHQVRVRQYDAAGNAGADSNPLAVTIDTAAPTLVDVNGSLIGRKFALTFTEAIRFSPSGRFELGGLFGNEVFESSGQGNSWQITDGNMLNFNISLTGFLRLQANNGSVEDMAGNAAVIGVPDWPITII
ncbi:Ig-like domain-containing protein [Telluria aromaticivorans]|uniref:Ig-like domain-containing protein n=1 Tax=Telluria aromaticivorans TaxID=2725995 RepID=A0A7Y2P0X4_9BURK|nr:Ig-like domain-containing protein [Telluria aromaticivorans]NNG24673.1 Ig-like domain-containing protein [Telluria aromaticivorans]